MDIKQLYDLYQQHPCITTDSRNCPKDSIFLALKGASFDGNKFAKTALDKGCAYAIIDEPAFAEADNDRLSLASREPMERPPPRSLFRLFLLSVTM